MLRTTTRTRSFAAVLAGAAVAAAAVGAHAAEPESGSVSKASPKVTWTGTVTGSYFNRIPVLLTQDDTVPCLPETCDSFALNVADSDDLTITADAPESTGTTGTGSQVTLRIRKPDDSVSVHTTDDGGASPEKPLTVKLKKAPAGDYTIEYFAYFTGSIDYNASATLGAPVAAQPGQPGDPTQPPETTQPPAQQELKIDVKARKVSARKANKRRKLAASVTVSREVQSVKAMLRKGKRVVARGSLGRTSGTAKLPLRVAKKLKKGKYALTVSATDGAGVSAVKTIRVRVSK